MLNIPVAIGDLHCWSRTVRILNEDGVGLAVDFIADPIRLKGKPIAIG